MEKVKLKMRDLMRFILSSVEQHSPTKLPGVSSEVYDILINNIEFKLTLNYQYADVTTIIDNTIVMTCSLIALKEDSVVFELTRLVSEYISNKIAKISKSKPKQVIGVAVGDISTLFDDVIDSDKSTKTITKSRIECLNSKILALLNTINSKTLVFNFGKFILHIRKPRTTGYDKNLCLNIKVYNSENLSDIYHEIDYEYESSDSKDTCLGDIIYNELK